jgi:hypothetical protein
MLFASDEIGIFEREGGRLRTRRLELLVITRERRG